MRTYPYIFSFFLSEIGKDNRTCDRCYVAMIQRTRVTLEFAAAD